ncbi:hypothetical protein CDD83_5581 [Cordyceps sp. RAO-2017]|nr:hypothetical protein CDD83_5581 [Cordyceps sp. RAO-2017]
MASSRNKTTRVDDELHAPDVAMAGWKRAGPPQIPANQRRFKGWGNDTGLPVGEAGLHAEEETCRPSYRNGQSEVQDELSVIGMGTELGTGSIEKGMEAVVTRKRLGELTRKYNDLKARHKDLWQMGIKSAERNFNDLKGQTEQNMAASNKLVAQLKSELTAQSTLVDQTAHRLECSQTSGEGLQAEINKLIKSLSDARAEVAMLSAKLGASKNFEASATDADSVAKANATVSEATTQLAAFKLVEMGR